MVSEAQQTAQLRTHLEEAVERLAHMRKTSRGAALAMEIVEALATVEELTFRNEARSLAADMHDAAELIESLYTRATDLWLMMREAQDAAGP